MKTNRLQILLASLVIVSSACIAMETTSSVINPGDSIAIMITDGTDGASVADEDKESLMAQDGIASDLEEANPQVPAKEKPIISKKDRFIATAYCYAQSFLGGLFPGATGFLKPAFMQTRLYASVAHKKKDAAEAYDTGSMERLNKVVNSLKARIDSWKDKYPEFHIWFSQTVKHGALVTIGNGVFYGIATAFGLPKEYCVILILYCQLAFYQGMLEKAQKKVIKRAVYNVLGLDSKYDTTADNANAEQDTSAKKKAKKDKKKKK